MIKYTRADNKPSAYMFAIGHCERFENNGSTVEMYCEHNTYHVRLHAPDQIQKVWENFSVSQPSQLSQARKRYNELQKSIK